MQDRSDLVREYGAKRDREALDNLARDAGIRGGQGRSPEDVGRNGYAGAILLVVGIIVVLLAVGGNQGCSTVSGLGRDLTAVSEGVRAEMATD